MIVAMDPHFDQDEAEIEHHEPSGGTHERKKKRQPKGILKNSNPNATYHKHHHRRKLDELVENERPEIIPTHTHHGRHRHHHEHHKHSHRHHHQESATQWAILTKSVMHFRDLVRVHKVTGARK